MDHMEVVSVSESFEPEFAQNALIVTERNQLTNEYSVFRYWWALPEAELKAAKLFSSGVYGRIGAIYFVSGEYAVMAVSTDGTALNEVKVVYYADLLGESVPANYGITILSDVKVVGSALSMPSDDTP